MLATGDLKGIMAMMPAFTTDDGGDIDATQTVDVQRLHDGVGRMLRDGGADVIGVTGSFGEATTLLPGELETLVRATVETVAGRVPVVVGCIGLHSRDVVAQARIAEKAGADAIMLGVPCYFPSTVPNAVQFLKDVAARFPKLGVMIYHNPPLHKIAIPVDAFAEIAAIPNVVGMKDSHRTTVDFQRLVDIVRKRMSLFVNHSQYNVYSGLGAAGFWAIDIWMGPEPMIALRDAVRNGDQALAREIAIAASFNRSGTPNMQWREVAHKIAVRYAGYCDPGPLRPPFIHVPDEVDQRQRQRAERWRALCKTYASAAAHAVAEWRRRPVDAVTLRREVESAMRRSVLISLGAALALAAVSARADATGDEAVAKFYRGKTVELLIGAQAGGGTDIAGRLVAQYLGKYIPGHPRVVPENVQGAGSLVLTNQLAHGLAPDGASLGILVSGVAQQPILGEPSAHFDPLKLTWIGTLSSGQKDAYLLVVRKSRGVSTVAQLRTVDPPILLGSSGGNSSNMAFANLGMALFGFHTKLIRGFDGTASVTLALRRGELDGLYSSYATLSKDSMMKSGALIPVVQAGRQARDPRFPDVPLLSELVSKPDDVALLSFAESIFLMNLPFAAPPDIPADRAAALQRAFLQAAADPGLVAEAQRLNIELSPQSGDYVKSVVAKMERTSPAVIARYKALTAP